MKAIVLFEFDVDSSARSPEFVYRWHRAVAAIRAELADRVEPAPVMGYVAIDDVAQAVLNRLQLSIPRPPEPAAAPERDDAQLGLDE